MTSLIRRIAARAGFAAAPRARHAEPAPRISADDADALLAIDADLSAPAPEWIEFVGETVSTWLVEQTAPHGEVDAEKTRWLLDRVDRDGHVRSAAALVLLQRCCIKARHVSAELRQYLGIQEARLRDTRG
ncbi:MAG TPA: hypothetical protein VN222_11775 [Novosphingobium sp.]|nr:hypothetical protein [Novosphingobium sp.]